MASSRWKRFAFFDRTTLNVPPQVLEDLIPSFITHESGRRISTLNTSSRQDEPEISMVVNTASLPSGGGTGAETGNNSNDPESTASQEPLMALWSSLTACSAPQDETAQGKFIRLPSQSTTKKTPTTTTTNSGTSLVLLWVTSPSTPYVHCFDLTLRCSALLDHDSDGWRGYFVGQEGIIDMATCRMPDSNHSALHVACLTPTDVTIYVDPHLHLSCRLPLTSTTPSSSQQQQSTIHLASSPWNVAQYGNATTMDMKPNLLAIGTDTGHILLMDYNATATQTISLNFVISHHSSMVTSLQLHPDHAVFCSYLKGICCFEVSAKGAVTARHDLDGRSNKIRADSLEGGKKYMVARPDGIYVYGKKQKWQVSPIDGTKNAICAIETTNKGSSYYALVASTDSKSGRYETHFGVYWRIVLRMCVFSFVQSLTHLIFL